MASKKKSPVKHCRIFQWIEAKDPEFAEAIRALCLEGVLSPGKGAGVTFLYPEDAKVRADIVAKAYSDDADEAVGMIEGLIIPDALPKAADFRARKVGNRLGVPFAVEGAEGNRVRLAGGAELTAAGDFNPLERRAGRVAVWRLTGRVPTEGSGYVPPPRAPKPKKVGGASPSVAPRHALIHKVGQDFVAWEAGGHRGPDPFLAAAVGLLHSLGADDLRRVTPLLDYYPHATLYLLLEPHKTTGGYLLSDEAVLGWGGARAARAGFAQDYLAFMGAGLPADAARQRCSRVDAARARLEASQPKAALTSALELYETGAFNADLPQETVGSLPGCKKLWMDELRYQFHVLLGDLTRPHSPAELAAKLDELSAFHPGNDCAAELSFMNRGLLAGDVAPRDRLLAARRFICSTDFLFQLVVPEAVGANAGSPNPDDRGLYNPSAEGLAYLQAAVKRAGSGEGETISPQAMRELRLYVQLNGKLPQV